MTKGIISFSERIDVSIVPMAVKTLVDVKLCVDVFEFFSYNSII